MVFSRVQKFHYASDVCPWPASAVRSHGAVRAVDHFAQHVRARSLALRNADGKSAFAAALRSQIRSGRVYGGTAKLLRGTVYLRDSSN